MKIYLSENNARSIQRVIGALGRYPISGIEIIDNEAEADGVILHVYGRINRVYGHIARLLRQNKSYAIMQYTLKGSRNPDSGDWIDAWRGARVVWSYLDLPEQGKFNFYKAPLGVDTDIFKPMPYQRDHTYSICAPGAFYMTESTREIIAASRSVGRKVFRLGSDLGCGPDVDCISGVSDQELTLLYNRCDYVSGLRRTEGFELPAAEGLLCGTRPIIFDNPCYRQWYDGLAEFIPENSRDEIVENLRILLEREVKPVTESELIEARWRFDWKTLVTGFWERFYAD